MPKGGLRSPEPALIASSFLLRYGTSVGFVATESAFSTFSPIT
jgi:hypothetical protein